jgi:threonine synthase
MDIQVSSNFERLYFELKGRDGAATGAGLKSFRAAGTLPASDAEWQQARTLFSAVRIDDEATLTEIATTYRTTGELLDPHSAVAVAAAKRTRRDDTAPMVALASAHPAKFPDAVERATGVRPPLPMRMADLYDRPERISVLPNDLAAVQHFIAERARPAVSPAGVAGGVA